MEVVHIPFEVGGTFPGVFLLLGSARMVRPVRQLPGQAVQLVGTLEQSTMDIACATPPPVASSCSFPESFLVAPCVCHSTSRLASVTLRSVPGVCVYVEGGGSVSHF